MADISICIPVYNYPVEPLIARLSKEITRGSINTEIIMIDDNSKIDIQKVNQQVAEKYSLRYIQLGENIGRSAIRNRFTNYANSDLLLFLDCDVMPESENFIQDYFTEAIEKESVICGGISYAEHCEKNTNLHWKYGRHREAIPAKKRNEKPYCHFLTGNFLIHKKILQQIQFNEELRGYGYEDTLYGVELQKNNVRVKHINLPAEHLKLDDPAAFITKTENALKNLSFLYHLDPYRTLLPQYVKLAKVYNSVKKYKLSGSFYFIYKIVGKKTQIKLINGSTNLHLLDFYKLLFFIALQRQSTKPYLY